MRDLFVFGMDGGAACAAGPDDDAVGRREQMREVRGQRREERRDRRGAPARCTRQAGEPDDGCWTNGADQRPGSRNATPKSTCRVKNAPAIPTPAPRKWFSVTRVILASATP